MYDQGDYTEDSHVSEDRERLYSLREMHVDALNRMFEEIYDEDNFLTITGNGLRVRKDRLQKHFNDMESAHALYRQVCILARDEIYENLESKLMHSLEKIEGRLQELSCNETRSFGPAEMAASSTMNPTVIRVETVRPPQIGKFNGSPAEWPAFRDLFIAEVHNKDFDPVTKLLYLQEACIEKAADTLGPWQPTSDNYKTAWEVMMAANNDEYHVIHGIIGKMFAVVRPEKENYDSLSTIYDALISTTRQLGTISNQSALWDQMWIHITKQRLPKQTLDSWEQYRNRLGTTRLATLDEFKQFLDTKKKGRREFEHEPSWSNQTSSNGKERSNSNGNRYKPYEKNSKSYDKNRSTTGERSYQGKGEKSYQGKKDESRGSGPPTSCLMPSCNETHYLGQCEAFRAWSLTERLDFTRQHRLCRCCLMIGHMAYTCTRQGCSKCPEAKVKHHFRLCPKTTVDNKTSGYSAKTEAPRP